MSTLSDIGLRERLIMQCRPVKGEAVFAKEVLFSIASLMLNWPRGRSRLCHVPDVRTTLSKFILLMREAAVGWNL